MVLGIGDFFQFPPVVPDEPDSEMIHHHLASSDAWSKVVEIFYLQQPMRTQNETFWNDCLDRLAEGDFKPSAPIDDQLRRFNLHKQCLVPLANNGWCLSARQSMCAYARPVWMTLWYCLYAALRRIRRRHRVAL